MKRLTLTLIAAAVLSACATPGGDGNKIPAQELPTQTASVPAVPADWWKQFGDAQLNALVDEALANNRDLARAMARIDESRAALRLARADQLPSVNANLSSARARASQNGPTPIPPGVSPVGNDHRISLDVAYEVDLWGRAANASAAAREELLATSYARETLRTALVAQVIQSYAALQSLDAQRTLYGRAVDVQRESIKLQRLRFNAGQIGELDIRQLEAELLTNETQLPKLDRARGEAERALARADKPVEANGGNLPAGLPSDLLLRRPDVQAAEARLRAAGARVDAARAAYFPSIALTASYGRESTELSRLTDAPSLIWSVVASLTQPIWNGGRIDAQNEIAKSRRLQAELDYRDSVANAFREARDALAAYEEARLSVQSNAQRAQALDRAAHLTRLRYEGGEASRLDVINAERLALSAQAEAADQQRALAAAQADVFRVLGGGWQLEEKRGS
jgi:multidrug efflux system outer membrane protein